MTILWYLHHDMGNRLEEDEKRATFFPRDGNGNAWERFRNLDGDSGEVCDILIPALVLRKSPTCDNREDDEAKNVGGIAPRACHLPALAERSNYL